MGAIKIIFSLAVQQHDLPAIECSGCPSPGSFLQLLYEGEEQGGDSQHRRGSPGLIQHMYGTTDVPVY